MYSFASFTDSPFSESGLRGQFDCLFALDSRPVQRMSSAFEGRATRQDPARPVSATRPRAETGDEACLASAKRISIWQASEKPSPRRRR